MRTAVSLILLTLSHFGGPPARADKRPYCNYHSVLQVLLPPGRQSAVELEMHDAVKLVTTMDGTVGGILKPGEQLPARLVDYLKKDTRFRSKDLNQVAWDSLREAQQKQVITEVTWQRRQVFNDDRVIHGLKIRDKMHVLIVGDPITFRGKTYGRGRHEVEVARHFVPAVEYKSPVALQNFAGEGTGIEIKLRIEGLAGDVSQEARNFQKLVDVAPTHQHVFAIHKLPLSELKREPILMPAMMGSFWERVNLASEVNDLVHQTSGLRQKKFNYADIKTGLWDDAVAFDNLIPPRLKEGVQYFVDMAVGKESSLGNKTKMSNVSLHGSDKFDTESDLWGMQIRRIRPDDDPDRVRSFLNSVHQSMIAGEYHYPDERMRKWLERMKVSAPEHVPGALSQIYYNQDWKGLELVAPAELKEPIAELESAMWYSTFHFAESHRELKMLAMDWSRHPLFFDRPDLLKKIIESQRKELAAYAAALRKVESQIELGKTNTQLFGKVLDEGGYVRRFLIESGIHEEVNRSIGLTIRPK